MISLDSRFKVIPAAYTILRRGDEILLLRRANAGYNDGQYSLPSGHIDGNESAVAAAARELKEEAGLDVGLEHFRFVHVVHRRSMEPELHERVDFFFEVRKWDGKPYNAEPNKCDELRWAKITDLPENMGPEVAHVLAKVVESKPYSDFNFSK